MRFSKTRFFVINTLKAGQLSNAFSTLFTKIHDGPPPLLNVAYDLPDGTGVMEERPTNGFDEICDVAGYHIWTGFSLADGAWFSLHIVGVPPGLRIEINTDKLSGISDSFQHFVEHLGLVERFPPDEDNGSTGRLDQELGELALRLDTIEGLVSSIVPQLRCFLSFRFSDANEVVALRVQRFLNLLGVDVITGHGYEPRSMSEKISSRLSASIDFLVLLVQADGESPWTRDEIATARSRGVPVIPLVEEGAEFSPAIFGDLEYVPYASSHVGDAFLALTEAVAYIRSERRTLVADVEE